MKNENRKLKSTLDELISGHLKNQHQQQSLGADFNRNLLFKINQLDQEAQVSKVFQPSSWLLPIILLVAVTVFVFIYLGGAELINFIIDRSISFDVSLLQTSGLKYTIYSLLALFIFSLVDRVLQIKMNSVGK